MRCDWRMSIHFVEFCIFYGQSVVSVIMIDGSKTRKSLVGVEFQSPYATERRSNKLRASGNVKLICIVLSRFSHLHLSVRLSVYLDNFNFTFLLFPEIF